MWVRVSVRLHRGGWEVRWRDASGRQRARRFACERAARDARRRLVEQVERGEVRHTKQTFGGYWERWLARHRPYLEPGTWSGYEIARGQAAAAGVRLALTRRAVGRRDP
jgi:hypothetical protein